MKKSDSRVEINAYYKKFGVIRLLQGGFSFESISRATCIPVDLIVLIDNYRLGVSLEFPKILIKKYRAGTRLAVLAKQFRLSRNTISEIIASSCESLGYRYDDLKYESASEQRVIRNAAAREIPKINYRVGESVVLNEQGFYTTVNTVSAKIIAIGTHAIFPSVQIQRENGIIEWISVEHINNPKKISYKGEKWPL